MRYSTQMLVVTLALAALLLPCVALWQAWAGVGIGALAGEVLARWYLEEYREAIVRLGWTRPPAQLGEQELRAGAAAKAEGRARGLRAGTIGGFAAVVALALGEGWVFQVVGFGAGLLIALLLRFALTARRLEQHSGAPR